MSQFWLPPDTILPDISQLWQRLETYLRLQAPVVLHSLNPPVTEGQLSRAAAELGIALPAGLAASLRVHDGQTDGIPLVPAEYDERRGERIATWGELLPLGRIVHATLREQEGLREWSSDRFDLFGECDGPVRRGGGWSWITIVDPGSGDRIGLDQNPPPDGRLGQVLSIVHDPGQLLLLAPSYRAWFEGLVERYESGRYAFEREGGSLSAVDRLEP